MVLSKLFPYAIAGLALSMMSVAAVAQTSETRPAPTRSHDKRSTVWP